MLDIIIVILYFATLGYVGFAHSSDSLSFKYAKSNKGYVAKFILVATLFTSAVGGGTVIGLMEKVFLADMSYVYGIVLATPIDVLLGYILLPKLAKYHTSISAGDILGQYYGPAGRIISGLAAIIISVGYIAAQVRVSAYVFQYLLGVESKLGVVASYTIIALYASFGGLKSVLYTNAIQFGGIILGIPLVTFALIYNFSPSVALGDGISSWSYTPNISDYQYKYSPSANPNLIAESLAVMLNFSLALLTPNFIQRGLLSQNVSIVKRALLQKSIIYAVFVGIIGLNGILLAAKYDQLNIQGISNVSADQLLDGLFLGAKGLIAVALLSAATSTADSDLNIISISLYQDIYKSLSNTVYKHEVLLFKFLTFIIGAFSILVALKIEAIVDIVMLSAGFWGPIIFIPLICGLNGIKLAPKQLIINSILTLIFCVIWDAQGFLIKAMFAGIIFNLLLFAISLMWNQNKTRRIAVPSSI